MGSPGEAQIRVWDDVAAQYMAAHPETKVEMNYQQDDLYQTIGLPTLLAGKNAPDVYFEWTGERLKQRQKDGYVADITEQFTSGPLKGLFDGRHAQGLQRRRQDRDGPVLGRRHQRPLVQQGAPRAGRRHAAHDVGRAARRVHQAQRRRRHPDHDRQQGPVARRQLVRPPRLARRGRGRLRADARRAPASSPRPSGRAAFGYIKQLADAKCVNDSANAIDDNAGAQLFFQGKAAMHPIGSLARLVGDRRGARTSTSTTSTCRRCRPRRKGNQDSVIGVATGYIVNAKSPKQKEAAEFMALLNSPENVQKLIEAEVTPLAISASEGQEIDSRSASLSSLLNNAPAVVLPPDTGYDLKTADALYAGIAAVLGGQATPADALAEIDRTLGR